MSKNNMQVVTGGGSMGEGIRLWDMRKLGKPVRQFIWDYTNQMTQEEKEYYVNPTINCVKFAPTAGTNDYAGAEIILAGCRDEKRGLPAKAFNARTGDIIHEFRCV
jgi:hypothetical protein